MFIKKKIIASSLLIGYVPAFLLIPNSQTRPIYKIFVNYNGQADLLLSLQIFPDYYAYQFKQHKLYDYLTDSNQYMQASAITSEKKQKLYQGFQNRLNVLTSQIKGFGPSLWNKDLYDQGLVVRNNQFWNTKEAEYLFVEQFIADDFLEISDSINLLPKHNKLIVTNYRAARDPYTIFGKETFDYFKNQKSGISIETTKTTTDSTTTSSPEFNKAFYDWYSKYQNTNINSLYRFGKYIDFWNQHIAANTSEEQTSKDEYYKTINPKEKLFNLVNEKYDELLAKIYASNLFTDGELNLLNSWENKPSSSTNTGTSTTDKKWNLHYKTPKATTTKQTSNAASSASSSTNQTKQQPFEITHVNYTKKTNTKTQQLHHPSLEHTPIKGTAPLAEGSQKEVMVYLYQFSKILTKLKEDSNFEKVFNNDPRKTHIEQALKNSKAISKNYYERIKKIRDYFKKLKVVDSSYDPENNCFTKTNSKSLGIITYPPNSVGGGNATIQTISKFPFIYRDLGFQQIVPNSIKDISSTTNASHDHEGHDHEHDEESVEEKVSNVFSVDDNGWWWNIGDTNIYQNNINEFVKTADSIIFLATLDDWSILNGSNNPKLNAFFSLLKTETKDKVASYEYSKINSSKYPFSYSRYNLWNEGLRSPIAVNLLLDNLVQIITNQYADPESLVPKATVGIATSAENANYVTEYKKALDWGDYWEENFIEGTNNGEKNNK